MNSRLALLICFAGALLVGLSFVLPRVVGGRQAWSQEEAAEHSRAMVKLHGLTLQHSAGAAGDKIAGDVPLDEARKDFQRGQQALDTARDRGQSTATVLRWLGILAVLGGGAAYLSGRR